MAIRNLPLRKLSISQTPAKTMADKQKAAQERYFINTVRDNPRFKLILAHLSQGTKPSEIAAHFAQQGWINISERTFAESLRAYRRLCAQEIMDVKAGGLDAIVSPNQPQNDVTMKLHQLLNAQFERIAVDMATEKAIGKLFNTTGKEMEVANKILETIAKIEGKITDGPARKRGEIETSTDVNENLTSLRKNESSMNRLHGLTRQLVKAPT